MEGLKGKLTASTDWVSPKSKSKSWVSLLFHSSDCALIHYVKVRYVSSVLAD